MEEKVVGAQTCLDMVNPDNEWRGKVCEMDVGKSSHEYTFGEWPLLFNTKYEVSVHLFNWNGFIGEPSTNTFTLRGMTRTTPMAVAPPTNLRIVQTSDTVIVQWQSAYSENGKALKPLGWRVCVGGSCRDPDHGNSANWFVAYTKPLDDSTITVQGIGKFNGVQILSEPVSIVVP